MEMKKSLSELKGIASQIRRDCLRMVHNVQSGHPGGSLGCADFFTALYFEIMDFDPKNFTMDGIGEDIFFLSNGHISPVLYSTLARVGVIEVSELATFRKLNSRLQGHPATHEHLPGIRIASGSLGQGMSVAIGAALAKKLNKDSHIVYSLHGDGELQEGQNWEAMLFAAQHKVDNLIVAVDYNHKQIDGPVESIMDVGPLRQKLEAFKFKVLECNGNDIQEIINTYSIAKSMTGNGYPIAVLLHTKMGYGVEFMEDDHKWHGVSPNNEQLGKALQVLEETLGDYSL